jgi:hypothetical protein
MRESRFIRKTAINSLMIGVVTLTVILGVTIVHASAQSAAGEASSHVSPVVLQNSDIIDMAKAGLGDEVVIAKIQVSACNFDTSPAALTLLKSAQVSNAIILAVVEKANSKAVNEEMRVLSSTVDGETSSSARSPVTSRRSFKVPMNHVHGTSAVIDGAGMLELRDQRLDWAETAAITSRAQHFIKPKHNFSVSCSEIREANLYFRRFHGINYWVGQENLIQLKIPKGTYEFRSSSGESAIVLLDTIRMTCNLGPSVLASSGQASQSVDGVAFDVFYKDGGGRGVLFVTAKGVEYEQVAVPQPSSPKLTFSLRDKVDDFVRVPNLLLPCGKLADITIHGISSDSAAYGFIDANPEIDVHDGAVTHKFFFGANIYAQAVKQSIADYCSRN